MDKLLVCHDVVHNELLRITTYDEVIIDGESEWTNGVSAYLTREEAGRVYLSIQKFLRTCPTCGQGRTYGEPGKEQLRIEL
jgi:hypothetical protein